jgi:hypothetical protein
MKEYIMKQSFVLNNVENLPIHPLTIEVAEARTGIFLEPDYSGAIMFRKDGRQVTTDFRQVFEKVHVQPQYHYFSFIDSTTGDSALIHRDVLRHVVSDALAKSMDTADSDADVLSEGKSFVHDVALEYLGL